MEVNRLILIILFILLQDSKGLPSINSVFYSVDCISTEGMVIEDSIITIYGKNLICEEDTTLSTEVVNKNEIKIYPNPTTDAFFICTNQEYEILIYDATGRFISTTQNLLNYENGIYLVVVKTNNNIQTFKLIKK
ncbi:T9SS type A sorting domain-containing protein [bacterium]|nr:T9SS type A sorting domain-containing protein [bacterium]